MARPFLRYSYSRDAYVLRVIGNKVGPVLVPRPVTKEAEPEGSAAAPE